MPRFKDENDFPDVETFTVDRRSFSNDELSGYMPPVPRAAQKLVVYDPVAPGSARDFDNTGYPTADTVPSPKDEESDGSFVNIRRSDDRRRTLVRSSNGWPSTLWGTSARLDLKTAWKPVFANPSEVIPCIERKVRREVLCAKRLHGRRGARRRPARRNYWSNVGC